MAGPCDQRTNTPQVISVDYRKSDTANAFPDQDPNTKHLPRTLAPRAPLEQHI